MSYGRCQSMGLVVVGELGPRTPSLLETVQIGDPQAEVGGRCPSINPEPANLRWRPGMVDLPAAQCTCARGAETSKLRLVTI